MTGARRVAVALGFVGTTAALAAAFVTADSWLYLLAGLSGFATLFVWQVRGGA